MCVAYHRDKPVPVTTSSTAVHMTIDHNLNGYNGSHMKISNLLCDQPRQTLQICEDERVIEREIHHLLNDLRAVTGSDQEPPNSGHDGSHHPTNVDACRPKVSTSSSQLALHREAHLVRERYNSYLRQRHISPDGFAFVIELSQLSDAKGNPVRRDCSFSPEIHKCIENRFLAQYLNHISVTPSSANIELIRQRLLSDESGGRLKYRFWWRSNGWISDVVQVTWAHIVRPKTPSSSRKCQADPKTELNGQRRRDDQSHQVVHQTKWAKCKKLRVMNSVGNSIFGDTASGKRKRSKLDSIFFNYSGGEQSPPDCSDLIHNRLRCYHNFCYANRYTGDMGKLLSSMVSSISSSYSASDVSVHPALLSIRHMLKAGHDHKTTEAKQDPTSLFNASTDDVDRLIQLFLRHIPSFPKYTNNDIEQIRSILFRPLCRRIITLLSHYSNFLLSSPSIPQSSSKAPNELYTQTLHTWMCLKNSIATSLPNRSLFILPLLVDGIICIVMCFTEFRNPDMFHVLHDRLRYQSIIVDQLQSLLMPIIANASDCPFSTTSRKAQSTLDNIFYQFRQNTKSSVQAHTLRFLANAVSSVVFAKIPNVQSPRVRAMRAKNNVAKL